MVLVGTEEDANNEIERESTTDHRPAGTVSRISRPGLSLRLLPDECPRGPTNGYQNMRWPKGPLIIGGELSTHFRTFWTILNPLGRKK